MKIVIQIYTLCPKTDQTFYRGSLYRKKQGEWRKGGKRSKLSPNPSNPHPPPLSLSLCRKTSPKIPSHGGPGGTRQVQVSPPLRPRSLLRPPRPRPLGPEVPNPPVLLLAPVPLHRPVPRSRRRLRQDLAPACRQGRRGPPRLRHRGPRSGS